jgi:predicted outer membrane repeat protein
MHGAIDPMLGPLADNGGPTMTHALLAGSPAINAGDLNAVAGVGGVPLYDQRGAPFGRVFNGRIDIGAFEYQQPSDLNLLVDTLVDESDGNYSRGDLSLREAIALANQYGSANYPSTAVDTIRFDPALAGGTILLTMGELRITDDVSIIGLGADQLTIDASGNDPTPDQNNGDGSRVFNIDNGTADRLNVSISGLRLTGGDVSGMGGAIVSAEDVFLADLLVDQNASFFSVGGNAIFCNGSLEIERSRIVGNQGSPGHRVSAVVYAGLGLVIRESELSDNIGTGGVFSGGEVLIADTTISRNSGTGVHIKSNRSVEILRSTISDNAGPVGGLSISVFDGGTALLSDSTIARNTALGSSAFGGGGARIDSYGTGVVTIQRSAFIENRAPSGGGIRATGNLHIIDSEFRGNVATSFNGNGGALVFDDVGGFLGFQYHISGSTFQNNTAGGAGGAIAMNLRNGAATLTGNTFSGNSAGSNGGGLYLNAIHSTALISQTTLHGNHAWSNGGGALIAARDASEIRVENSTIDANTARLNGGGIELQVSDTSEAALEQINVSGNSANGIGGGISVSVFGGVASIEHSTITFNGFGVQHGGGIVASGSGTLALSHTIVAGNIVPSNIAPDFWRNLANVDFSYNLIGNSHGTGLTPAPVGSPDANGNLIGGTTLATQIDPRLAPLADNGGPTFTHALLPDSPAVNAGDPAAMAGVGGVPVNDQRGAPFTRVYGGRIDIGAFELQPTQFVLGDFNRNGSVDAADYVLWRKQMGTTVVAGTGADANGDGAVDYADHAVWMSNLGQTSASLGAAGGEAAVRAESGGRRAAEQTTNESPIRAMWTPANQPSQARQTSRSATALRLSATVSPVDAERMDRALAAWLTSRSASDSHQSMEPSSMGRDVADERAERPRKLSAALDRVFETLGAASVM